MKTPIKKLMLAACCLPFLHQPALADGNLTAAIVDSTLFIIGDKENNSLVVSEFEPAYFSTITCDSENCRSIMVAGRARNDYNSYLPWFSSYANVFLSGDGGTDVNGGDLPIFFDACQVNRVVIITAGGADRVLFRGMITAEVEADTGAGDDRVQFVDSLGGADSVFVNTGLGDDRVLISELTSAGPVSIATGNGRDRVDLSFLSVLGSLEINTGAHDDVLFPSEIVVSEDIDLQVGQGNDAVIDFFGGPGITIFRAGEFSGGQGTDVLDVNIDIADESLLNVSGFESP